MESMEESKYRANKKYIMVDMDGTLAEGEAWTVLQAETAEPRKEIIEKVNTLYPKHFIVIYTARKDELLPATLGWLRKHNVRFHAISNNKVGADVYVDDRAIRPEELSEGIG